MPRIEEVRDWLHTGRNAVVLTGAGISTDSGIPDFRGPNGVWTKNPAAEKSAHIDHYMSDPEVRRKAWRSRLESRFFDVEANDAHRAVAALQRAGAVSWVVTQNIDGLHQAAGSPPETVLELHGTVHRTRCMQCGDQRPMGETLDRVRDGAEEPPCLVCGGILKSATISFGQQLDPEVLDKAAAVCAAAPLLIVVGSTLAVYPAAGLVPLATRSGARLVIVNNQPTDYDDIADVVLREPIGEVVPAFLTGSSD